MFQEWVNKMLGGKVALEKVKNPGLGFDSRLIPLSQKRIFKLTLFMVHGSTCCVGVKGTGLSHSNKGGSYSITTSFC